jgi:hypothetical protein
MQRVVHGLRGHAAKLGAGPVDDCLDIEMFAGIDRVEHGPALSGYPQPGPAQTLRGRNRHTY